MFSKFKKEVSQTKSEDKKKVTTDNILEVFSKDMMNEKKKDLSDSLGWKDPVLYMSKFTWGLKFGFFILLFFTIVLYSYGVIQNNEEADSISLLEPICFLFLWDEVAKDYNGCASISSARMTYKDDLNAFKKVQAEKVLSILDKVYSIDNFLFTEDISFLLEKSSTKLPVIQILSEFNALKDSFEPTTKVYAIECNDMTISNNLEVEMSCSTYSSDWSDSNIMWFNGQTTSKKISGTSISVASSFINFINKKWENFQVIETSKVYWYAGEPEEWKERYTRKTNFDLRLKYINPLAK